MIKYHTRVLASTYIAMVAYRSAPNAAADRLGDPVFSAVAGLGNHEGMDASDVVDGLCGVGVVRGKLNFPWRQRLLEELDAIRSGGYYRRVWLCRLLGASTPLVHHVSRFTPHGLILGPAHYPLWPSGLARRPLASS